MNALRLLSDGPGYAPARVARMESEAAMRRALPASFVLVSGMLVAFMLAVRLVPLKVVPVDLPHGPDHHIVNPPGTPPDAGHSAIPVTPLAEHFAGAVVPVRDSLASMPETAVTASGASGVGTSELPRQDQGTGGGGSGEGVDFPTPGTPFFGE